MVRSGAPSVPSRPFDAFAASAVETARLLWRHRLVLPPTHVGRRLTFADGTTSRVYRETLRVGADTREPTLLVVQFRLRGVGTSRVLHALFRIESLANTPLFAGFPGFRSKLWLTDLRTGVYRGVYEWDGEGRARSYATTLVRLLAVVSVPGTVRFHTVGGVRRDDALRDTRPLVEAGDSGTWWRPVPGAGVAT